VERCTTIIFLCNISDGGKCYEEKINQAKVRRECREYGATSFG
jgi:hypothetical protein